MAIYNQFTNDDKSANTLFLAHLWCIKRYLSGHAPRVATPISALPEPGGLAHGVGCGAGQLLRAPQALVGDGLLEAAEAADHPAMGRWWGIARGTGEQRWG